MSTDTTFLDRTITAPEERCHVFGDLIRRYAAPDLPLRVLEVGCGTGQQLMQLARALPAAQLTGIDVSAPNVARAEAARRRLPFADRLRFVCGDYLALDDGLFDLIVADTTLHLIRVPTPTLFGKVGADLAPDGLLVNCMPYACAYNRALRCVRRLFRACRGRFTDALIFRAGKLLHGREFSDEALRERVCYMYLQPECYDGPALHALLAGAPALDLVGLHPVPHVSLAKPRHRVAVFRKRGGNARPAAPLRTGESWQ